MSSLSPRSVSKSKKFRIAPWPPYVSRTNPFPGAFRPTLSHTGIAHSFSDGGCSGLCHAGHVHPGASCRSWRLWRDHRHRRLFRRVRDVGARAVSQGTSWTSRHSCAQLNSIVCRHSASKAWQRSDTAESQNGEGESIVLCSIGCLDLDGYGRSEMSPTRWDSFVIRSFFV